MPELKDMTDEELLSNLPDEDLMKLLPTGDVLEASGPDYAEEARAYRMYQQADMTSAPTPQPKEIKKYKSWGASAKTVFGGVAEGLLPESNNAKIVDKDGLVHNVPSAVGSTGPAAAISTGLWFVRDALNKGFKLDEIRQQYGDDAGYKIAKFIGEVAPVGKALKVGGVVGKAVSGSIAKRGLGQILGAGARGAATGALYETYKQSGKIGTDEFSPTDIAATAGMFVAPEMALASGGVALRNIMGEIRENPASKLLYKSDSPKAALGVNDTRVPVKPNEPWRQAPSVRNDELAVMRGIPVDPVPTNPLRQVSDAIETAPRMHESAGTKELMLDPVRQANGVADRAVAASEAEVKQVIKENLPFWGRRKASERIYSYAIGQQGGGAELLKGMGVEIPALTDKEMRVYEFMRSKYETLFNDLNRARTSAGIAPFPKVENYFTFFRNMAGEVNDGITFENLNFAKLNRTVFRFEKNRIIDNYGQLELDAIGGFLRYNRAAQRHIQLTPVVAKLRQLLDGKFTDGFSLRESNPYAYNKLNGWVNRVAGMPDDAFKVPHGVEKVMRQLNRNLMFGVLSYTPRTAAIQPSSLLNTMVEIGPKYTLQGAVDYLQNPQEIMRKSWGLFGREFDASVAEAANTIGGRLSAGQHAFGEFGLRPLKALDMMTAQVTWAGAYRRGRALGMAENKAIAYAEDVVARTQAVATASEIAPIQATAVGRLGTAFQTFVINNWGFLTRDVAGIGNPAITNKEAMKKVMGYIVGAQAFNLIYENGMGMRSPFPSPVKAFAESMEQDDNLTKAVWTSGAELFDQVPLVGGALRYGSSPLGAGVQAINDLAKFGRYDMTAGKAAETIGKTLGIPGTVAVKKAIKFTTEEDK